MNDLEANLSKELAYIFGVSLNYELVSRWT